MARLPGASEISRRSPRGGGGPPRVPDVNVPSPNVVPLPRVRSSGAAPSLTVGNLVTADAGVGNALIEISRSMAAAEAKVRKSEEAFSRVQAFSEYEEAVESEMRERRQTRDLSLSAETASLGAFMQAKAQEVVERYPGSDEHHLKLLEGLEQRRSGFAGTLSAVTQEIKTAKTDRILGRQLNQLARRAMDGGDLVVLFNQWQQTIGQLQDTMSIEAELSHTDVGRSALVMAKFEGLLGRGAIDQAEDILDIPGVPRLLDAKTLDHMRDRIAAARQAIEGEAFTLRPGDRRFDAQGNEIASVPAEGGGGFTLGPGEKRFDEQGNEIASGPSQPPQRFRLRPGEELRDAEGNVIARGPEKPKEDFTLSPGQERISGETGETIASVEAEPPSPEPLQKVVDKNSVTGFRWVPRSEAAGKDAPPLVPLVDLSEDKFLSELGKGDAKRVEKLQDSADLAQQDLTDIVRIREALERGDFKAGVLADQRALISRALALLEVDGAEVDKLIGSAETANEIDAAAARLAVQSAQQGGRITNLFLHLVRDSLPSLTRTEAGNKILVAVMERQAKRKIEIAKIAQRYARDFKSLRPPNAPSFFEEVNALEERDPVVTPELIEKIRAASASAPKSIRSVLQGKDGPIPLPKNAEGVPEGRKLRFKSGPNAGKWFQRKGDELVPTTPPPGRE